MASVTAIKDPLQVLPEELHPKVNHLVTEDETPVDNLFSEKQQRLLAEPLYSSWSGPGPGRPFAAMTNVGLFYTTRESPYVPDALLSLDVEVPADLWLKGHRSYFIWEYGKPPDVVVEVVSNREGGEDGEKLEGYARVGVGYYVIYDPERIISREVLRAYRLEGRKFRQMKEPFWFPDVGLGLQIWQGRYEDHENTWIRWVEEDEHLIPSGKERAEAEKQRAEAEKQRAEAEKQRADRERERGDRLAEQLRRLGVEPNTSPQPD
jgi:Uma2 family endonuclease